MTARSLARAHAARGPRAGTLLYFAGARRPIADRPRRPRPHARARGAVLHAPPRRSRRARRQGRAARTRRRDAPWSAPARGRPRGPEHLLRALQCGQGEHRPRPRPPRGPRGRARPGADIRRRRRELRARRRRAPGRRLRDARRGEAGSRVLLDLGLRPDRPLAAPPRLRAHHQCGLRHDAPRAGAGSRAARGKSTSRGRARRELTPSGRSWARSGGERARARARGSTSPCSSASSRPTTRPTAAC